MDTEAKLRSALSERAGSIDVADPGRSVKQRISALRHRRRRRMALGAAAIATLVTAVALAPVLASSGRDVKVATVSAGLAAPARPGVLASRLVRDTRPSVPKSTVAALTAANTRTAIDLYHQLAATPGNVFFSPYSITTALTMAAGGARGETLTQMLTVLHDTLPPATLQDATNALNLALLAPRPCPAAPTAGRSCSNGQPLELEVANSEWGQAGYRIESAFLDLLARDYGAALNTVDYQQDPTGATKAINDWVAAHTNNKIRRLFASLDPSTRLVLANAVHFKASWSQPFSPAATRSGPFTTATGSTVSVPFMHGVVRGSAASGDGWQAVDLPYIGDASMTLIVPDAGQFASFERSLDSPKLASILGALAPSDITLSLPKLQLKDQSDLIPALQKLGMTDAFQNADFSGISGTRQLSISQIVHQATINVDEQGTEAAAATGIAFLLAGEPPTNLSVDRPYLLLIRDDKTGAILFLGRVTDPTQTAVQQP
jgi:serpin B